MLQFVPVRFFFTFPQMKHRDCCVASRTVTLRTSPNQGIVTAIYRSATFHSSSEDVRWYGIDRSVAFHLLPNQNSIPGSCSAAGRTVTLHDLPNQNSTTVLLPIVRLQFTLDVIKTT